MDEIIIAKEKRDQAARARRLARVMVEDRDRDALLAFADVLDAQAFLLERKVAAPAPPNITRMQMQVQQGPPVGKPTAG
jgi:hypothetical protein